MSYKENPKTKGSGVVCCIPQSGTCPNKCPDCFFQSGRSYLEPLIENLPNMPTKQQVGHRILRINDGNDSNFLRSEVENATKTFPLRFFNTAIPELLSRFSAPVVLTVNPGKDTDVKAHLLEQIPKNLMFVRVRTNAWNIEVVKEAVSYYTDKNVPVILTFMAYYTDTVKHPQYYEWKKRTLNSYWVLKCETRHFIEDTFYENSLVYTCGWRGTFACHRCGNCLREYFATMERLSPFK